MIFIPKKWSAWGEPKAEPDGKLAGRQGFEPRYADPESAVLPLDDLPAGKVNRHFNPAVQSKRSGAAASDFILQLAGDDRIIEPAEKAVSKPFWQFEELRKQLRRRRARVYLDFAEPRLGEIKIEQCRGYGPRVRRVQIKEGGVDGETIRARRFDRDHSAARQLFRAERDHARQPERVKMLHHLRAKDSVEFSLGRIAQEFEQISGFGLESFGLALSHGFGAQVDPLCRNAHFAHQVQEFTAPASDIQDARAAFEPWPVKILGFSDLLFGSAETLGESCVVEARRFSGRGCGLLWRS